MRGRPHPASRRTAIPAVPAFSPAVFGPLACRSRRAGPHHGLRSYNQTLLLAFLAPFPQRPAMVGATGVLMSKILLVAVIVVAVLLLMRGLRRRDPPADASPAAEAMVRCAHCDLHLPRAESITAGGRHFCCEQHRRDAGYRD